MDESAEQFLRRVRFLSLITADISYIQDEKEFYLDRVRQPVSYSFDFGESKLVVEIDHLVDFTLKNNWVIHEKMPSQDRIVGARTIQYDGLVSRAIEAAPEVAAEPTPTEVIADVDVPVEENSA